MALAADSKQGEDLVALDVSGPLPLTDIFFLATGRNERNVQAIATEIEDKMIEAGAKPLRREGRAEGRWILLDFGDVVAHSTRKTVCTTRLSVCGRTARRSLSICRRPAPRARS